MMKCMVFAQAGGHQVRHLSYKDRDMFRSSFLPVFWFLAATATLIHYQRNYESGGAMYFNGFVAGVQVSIGLAVVLVFRIFRRVEDILISQQRIAGRISTPYDLIPFLLLGPFAFQWRAVGEIMPDPPPGETFAFRWVFEWGQHEYRMLLFLVFIGLLFLYRTHQLLRAVGEGQRPE